MDLSIEFILPVFNGTREVDFGSCDGRKNYEQPVVGFGEIPKIFETLDDFFPFFPFDREYGTTKHPHILISIRISLNLWLCEIRRQIKPD